MEVDVDESFIALPAPDRPAPARSRLQAIFAADRARERARARRQRVVGLLGALGVPLWLSAVWPARLPVGLGSFVAAAWALAFGGFVLALIGEGITILRRAREIETLGPLPVLRSARRPAASACAAPAEDED